MSDLLLHWLNNELQLSVPVSNVEHDFASGYLLGEILERLNQQHNFSDFMDRNIADAKIINFCLLEPTLRRLHIAFDSKIATAIMNGTPGAAANLLYQIQMAAERLARAPAVSLRADERRPLHNVPSKLAKPQYDAAHHYFFEHSVRRQVKSLNALAREKDAVRVEKQRMVAYREQQGEIEAQLQVTRAERLHQAFLHSAFIKTALDETDSPAWRLALEKKRERERRKAQFYRRLLAEKAERHDAHTYSLRQTVETDLDDFERGGANAVSPASSKGRAMRKSLGYGLRSLSTTLEHDAARRGPGLRDPAKPIPLGDATPEHANNAATIRSQKHHRDRRRDQLDRRRKRFLQDALSTQTFGNAHRMASDMETLVSRHTPREAEAQHAMNKILVYKAIATENRTRRDESCATRRDMDLHDAIDRDTAVFELLFAKYVDDGMTQVDHSQRRIAARAAAQQYENRLVASCVLHELLDFAMVVARNREDAMHARDGSSSSSSFLLTDERWRELRFEFAEHGVDESGVKDTLVEYELAQYLDQFAPLTFLLPHDYVGAVTKGTRVSPWVPTNWKFCAATESVEDRYVLGETVKYIRWLAHHANMSPAGDQAAVKIEAQSGDEPIAFETASGNAVIDALRAPNTVMAAAVANVEPEDRPRVCILLLGPPFAGKTTQAALLAAKYDLALLSVERQLQVVLSEPSELGREAHAILGRGEPLPPRIYSLLVLDAIARLDRSHRQQWVLYDLPPTRAHAESLEQHLTGFIEPSDVPSPYDYASRLAPAGARPNLPQSFLHGKSGVDLVFYLECAEPALLERCLGALEDAETHADTHHLVFNPPALDATDRYRLQHVNRTTTASALLSLHYESTQQQASDAKAWFMRFNTLRAVDTTERPQNVTAEATHARLVSLIEAFFDGQRAAADTHQRDKELEETVAMEQEEHRQLKLAELKNHIREAQDDVAKAQTAVQQAEEAKVKKEEIAELRTAVESAKKRVEQALVDARDWRMDEGASVREAQLTYSSRLEPPLARVLATTWDAMERAFTSVMHACLDLQRRQRTRVEERVQWIVTTICRFFRRIDTKQRLVDAFQTQFNDVADDMRFDDATKAELHARVDVLHDELRLATTMKQQASDHELSEILSDGWREDTCQWIALSYQRMLQAECDRFRVSLELLVDAFEAASRAPAQLAGVSDALKAHPQLLRELTLKTFVDASDDLVAQASTTPAVPPTATGKAGAKPTAPGKGKPPLAPQAAAPADATAETTSDPLAPETLLLSYDLAMQKADALVELITTAPPKDDQPKAPEPPPSTTTTTKAKTGATPAATPSATPVSSMVLLPRVSTQIDVATTNFSKAVIYEHEHFVKRVRFLKDAGQTACDHVARTMRSVETTLHDAIEARAMREDAAVAALVHYVRTAIEAETNLPFYINVQPDQVYRFPVTQHLLEDTRVTVDARLRLVARAPIDPPPQIELNDAVLVNGRQADELRRRLGLDDGDKRTIVEVVSVLQTLATEPHALPVKWQEADDLVLAQVVAPFADAATGLVDTLALLHAMETGTTLLVSVQQTQQQTQDLVPGLEST